MSKYNFDMDLAEQSSTGAIISQITPGSTVLEFGCAAGRMTKYLKDKLNCKVYIVEICEKDYEVAINYAEDGFCGDIMSFEWLKTFSDVKFDYVLFADVLEHLTNPTKVLKELKGLLLDDGKIICSVPNNAHGDIILNLYENRFKYTDIGLLDNTHIHLFGYKDICDMVQESGYKIVVESATHTPVFSTEQAKNLNRDNFAHYEQILAGRAFSDVYQFIMTIQKAEYVIRNGILKQSNLKFYPEIVRCELILNKDFSNPIVINPTDMNGFNFSYEAKFEPCQEFIILLNTKGSSIIEDFCVKADIKNTEVVFLNAHTIGNLRYIENHSPQVLIKTQENIDKVSFAFSLFPVYGDVDNAIFNNTVKSNEENLKIAIQQDARVNELQGMIASKEQYIEKLCKDIYEKDVAIEKKNQEIAQKDAEAENKERIITHITNQNAELNFKYNDIINSFYWKITSPPRIITHKIKTIIVNYSKIMKFFVFLKGFLRGGIKEGKNRLASYKVFIGETDNDFLEISKKTYTSEREYKFNRLPKISILVPLYNTPDNFLKEMIDSVLNQTYSNWELCLADGSTPEFECVERVCKKFSSKDNRIVYKKLEKNLGISENTNECLKMATGDYIALFDHDDLLHPSALFEYVKTINEQGADFIYCDEATFVCDKEKNYKIVLKHHKPEFSPDTLRSYNYICHFACFSRKLYEIVGGFNSEYDGSQDYDMILRLTEKAKKIVRVPKLLYFWRSHTLSVASDVSAKPYVVNSAIKALSAHLKRVDLKGAVTQSYAPTTYRIKYEINGNPKVSIIIPNKDHIGDLKMCLDSIFKMSTYNNIEIIIVENNSQEKETFDYYKVLENEHQNIKVVKWEETGFNYSKINNYGARFANGEYILLLNNDIEIITPNWIEEMLMFAQRNDVGAVGAKLYYPDDTIQHAGVILGIGGVAGHSHKYYGRKDYGYVSRACISQNLSACTAACLLIRKDVFDEIKGLDEEFAVAFNDIDLCMKIRQAGYLIVFTPYAEFYHYESKSRGFEDSPEKVARFNSEIDRFMEKWGMELEKGDPYYNPNLTLDREDFSLK